MTQPEQPERDGQAGPVNALDAPLDLTDPERSMHRVAVVVFCEAPGVDFSDAEACATAALRHRLRGGATGITDPTQGTRPAGVGSEVLARVGYVRADGLTVGADVYTARELGTAQANGLLNLTVGSRAYPRPPETNQEQPL